MERRERERENAKRNQEKREKLFIVLNKIYFYGTRSISYLIPSDIHRFIYIYILICILCDASLCIDAFMNKCILYVCMYPGLYFCAMYAGVYV